MEIPVRMRQTRMHPATWESPPGFKCQTVEALHKYGGEKGVVWMNCVMVKVYGHTKK